MSARLIFKGNDLNRAFEISAARTVIGRRPREIEHIAKVEGKETQKSPSRVNSDVGLLDLNSDDNS